MRTWRRLSVVFVAAMLLAAMPVSAADKKGDREREQLKRLQQSQRKLEQENSRLAQEKTVLDSQLKETRDKLGETERKARRAAARAAALDKSLKGVQAEKDALTQKLAESEKKLAESERKLAETSEVLRKAEAAGRNLDAGLKEKTQSLAVCEAKNEKLHDYGKELLDKYEKKGCGDAMLQGETFTQLKRVEIENLVEDYREKLDEQKLDRPARR